MGRPRYTVDDELIDKSFIENVVESLTHLDTDEATRVTITDEATGKTESAAGADYDEALGRACRKLGISPGDLDNEIEDDD
jgi:hypothetical protein